MFSLFTLIFGNEISDWFIYFSLLGIWIITIILFLLFLMCSGNNFAKLEKSILELEKVKKNEIEAMIYKDGFNECNIDFILRPKKEK